jgi:glycosyltransferase involved in cell wall biosynthesis
MVGSNNGRRRLAILDDLFPLLISGFRLAEYNAYLAEFPGAQVYSTGSSLPVVRDTRTFEQVREEYIAVFPDFAHRVHKLDDTTSLEADFAYTIFAHNIFHFLPLLERNKIPFAFTLYPGGGFGLDDESSDERLRRVFSSPSFANVIVTQVVPHEYLLKKKLCRPDQIVFLYGGICQELQYRRRYYAIDKKNLDICFAAFRYADGGRGKGYDIFIEVAHLLAKEFPEARFHIVGGFTDDDADITDIADRVTFYGTRHPSFFQDFYQDMDLIISPNRPFTTSKTHFDGFPTGCCAEAALVGVPVFCTDPLNLNITFRAGEEIVIISHEPADIFGAVAAFCREPHRLARLSKETGRAFQNAFGYDAQMRPRIELLSRLLAAQ